MEERLSDIESKAHLAVWIVGVGVFCAGAYATIRFGLMLLHLYGLERTHRRKGWGSKADVGLSKFAA